MASSFEEVSVLLEHCLLSHCDKAGRDYNIPDIQQHRKQGYNGVVVATACKNMATLHVYWPASKNETLVLFIMSYDIEMTLKSSLHVLLRLSIWHETELRPSVTQRMQYFQMELGMREHLGPEGSCIANRH